MRSDPGPAYSLCHLTRVRAIIVLVVKKEGATRYSSSLPTDLCALFGKAKRVSECLL